MDITPIVPLEKELQKQLSNERSMLDIAQLSIQICNALKIEFTEASKDERAKAIQEIEKYLEYVQKHYDENAKDVQDKMTELTRAQQIRDVRKNDLVLPKTYALVHSKNFCIKDVVMLLGKIGPENAHEMRHFLDTLISYGISMSFSENDFKNSLNACFEGTLKEQYLDMREESFKYISTWMDTVYNVPLDFRTAEKKIRKFFRRKDETITVFFKRYSLLAKKVDNFLPENEKFFTTTMHKLNLMEQVLLDPAKSEYIKWKDRFRDSALPNNFEEHLAVAYNCEKYHNCVPTKNINISHNGTSSYAKLMPAQESFVMTTRSKTKETGQTPVVTSIPKAIKRTRKKVYKASHNKQIDPEKASGDRPSFFNARKTKPNPGPTIPNKFHRTPPRQGNPKSPTKSFSTPKARTQPPRGKNFQQKFPRVIARRKLFAGNSPQGTYCMKCGVKRGVDKTQIRFSHSSRDCRNYPSYCKTLCPYCLQVKGLEAYHPLDMCRQKKRQQSETAKYHKRR